MKDIAGYEGLYAATSCGRIYSYRSNKFLKPRDNGRGYLQVVLWREGKQKWHLLHRLIAETYMQNPDPENLIQVNHRDEVKSHNWVGNLEWCDVKYNLNYGTRNDRVSKALTNNPKISHRIRCVETGEEFESLCDCSRKLCLNKGSLSEHLRGIRHKHVGGYTFERIE